MVCEYIELGKHKYGLGDIVKFERVSKIVYGVIHKLSYQKTYKEPIRYCVTLDQEKVCIGQDEITLVKKNGV